MRNKRYALFMLALMAALIGFKLFLHFAKWHFISDAIPSLMRITFLGLLILWMVRIYENTEHKSKATATMLWSALAVVGIYILSFAAAAYASSLFHFLSGDAFRVALWIMLLIVVFAWIVLICQNKQAKYWGIGLSMLTVLMLGVCGSIFMNTLFGSLSTREIARFDSPDGKRQVLVMDRGFIDALYTAHPVKLRYFYQEQDNGYAAPHDFTGGDIQVTWGSDTTAIVTVSGSYVEPQDPERDGEIIVTFE